MKTELLENFKLIEFNCKDQFGLHRVWVFAKASMTAFKNGKYNLAMYALKKLQLLVRPLDGDKKVVDATKTIDFFVSQMVDVIKSADPDAKYPPYG